LAKFADKNFFQKSGLKRDGPVFFKTEAVILAGDENTIIVIVASRWGEASPPDTCQSSR
jgi:hypothetical protein